MHVTLLLTDKPIIIFDLIIYQNSYVRIFIYTNILKLELIFYTIY